MLSAIEGGTIDFCRMVKLFCAHKYFRIDFPISIASIVEDLKTARADIFYALAVPYPQNQNS